MLRCGLGRADRHSDCTPFVSVNVHYSTPSLFILLVGTKDRYHAVLLFLFDSSSASSSYCSSLSNADKIFFGWSPTLPSLIASLDAGSLFLASLTDVDRSCAVARSATPWAFSTRQSFKPAWSGHKSCTTASDGHPGRSFAYRFVFGGKN